MSTCFKRSHIIIERKNAISIEPAHRKSPFLCANINIEYVWEFFVVFCFVFCFFCCLFVCFVVVFCGFFCGGLFAVFVGGGGLFLFC